MFRKYLLLSLVMVMIHSLLACSSKEVTFPDTGLEVAIRIEIGKPEGVILTSDSEGLISLHASERDIADLTGLEHCTKLTRLYL